MARHFGTVIVGGAVMGSSVAYFLSENPDYNEKTLVVEPDPTYVNSSTMRSNGSIRHQFSTPENIAISQFATEFIYNFHENVQVDGEAPELGFVDTGYLFLADATGMEALRQSHEIQAARGVESTILDRQELGRRFVHLNTDGLMGGSIGEKHEGTFDQWSFLQGFRNRARANGVEYIQDRVVGIDHAGDRVRSVTLGSGEVVTCDRVVNCAGPRASVIADMVDLDLPVEPRLRSSFVFACQTSIDGPFPLHIDTSGVHVRREGPNFLAGTKPIHDVAVDYDDLDLRMEEFEELVWPALAHRIPQFEAILLKASWGGHYAYNTLDHNMIVGPSPIANFYFCNGFSGHGLQQSAGVGRALSEHITYGSFQSIDLSPMGYDRILTNQPVIEKNVI